MADERVLAALACNRDVPNEKPSANQDCSDVVNISVFFDGTGNNKDVDEGSQKWSNVARLWRSAFFLFGKGKPNYPIYISGVGTPYNGNASNWLDKAVIAAEDNDFTGGGVGAGGARRTELGQRNVNDTLRNVLIANAKQLGGTAKAYAEKSKDQSYSELGKALKAHRLIKFINLSIFGFSRGAALARAFSNDFLKQCERDKDGRLTYEGYPIRIHFMGLFDTVASFGVPAGNVDLPFDERNLVVPECVERCVHLVAGHELRFSFPVDLIRHKGKLKAGWREEVYPGVHSDVGGGYLPVDQGLSNNYARIPMREMMREAVIHGVRMLGCADIEKASNQVFTERFAIAPRTQGDYDRYTAAVGASSGSIEVQVKAHMKALYAAYGTMNRKGIPTPHARQTQGNVKALGHTSMAGEVAQYRRALGVDSFTSLRLSPTVSFSGTPYVQVVQIEPWRLSEWERTASDAELNFVASHVHDSKVDFLMNAEPFSYFRPRGMAESSRNVLAQGLQWLDDAAESAKKGVLKIYYGAEGVVVETWKGGVLVGTHTYRVGERVVFDAVQAGERYAVEVIQTTKEVTISAVETGQKVIVESTQAVGKFAKSAGRKASEVVGRARAGAREASDAFGGAVDDGAKAVEAGWNATRARLGLI